MSTELTRLVGKFSLAVDEIAYELSLAGCDDETGDVSEGDGWYGLLRGFEADGSFCDLSADRRIALNGADLSFLAQHSAGCIIHENSQGFVNVHWFDDAAERDAVWDRVIADEEQNEDDFQDDPAGGDEDS